MLATSTSHSHLIQPHRSVYHTHHTHAHTNQQARAHTHTHPPTHTPVARRARGARGRERCRVRAAEPHPQSCVDSIHATEPSLLLEFPLLPYIPPSARTPAARWPLRGVRARAAHREQSTVSRQRRDKLTRGQCANGREGLRRSSAAQQYGRQRQHAPGEAHSQSARPRATSPTPVSPAP